MSQIKNYGTWKSPISSKLATESSVTFPELHVDRGEGCHGNVYWSEMRFDEGGRIVICSKNVANGEIKQWTPEGFNARTLVHEYGGGAFFVHDGCVYFCNFKDQRMYMQKSPTDLPIPITPSDSQLRYADGEYCPKHSRIYCVREDHSLVEKGVSKEAVNTIVVINPLSQKQEIIASGYDFYSCPRVSPDGTQIAWIQWKHPNMPWDSTELCVANLDQSGDFIISGSIKKLAETKDLSIIHPRWTPSGDLIYIGDETNWWNLYQVTSSGKHVNLMPIEKEIGVPHWAFASYTYDIDPSGSGNIVLRFGSDLGILNIKTKEYKKIDAGFTNHSYVQITSDGKYVFCQGGSPKKFAAIIQIQVDNGKVDVLKESKKVPVDVGYFSIPKKISWETANKETAYGYLYLPQNKDFSAPEGTLPPLLVKCHGGPTSCASDTLNLRFQYFTSRGFALLDTDYRGSTGYGKPYRHRLRRNWGVCDIEDASKGAKHLADTGVVDGEKLCIDGQSAGGYTTLACLAFTDVFKAGASHYGIADLAILAAETHKFESRYCDNLIAPYTEENKPIYDARSPIKHIDQFNCAIAFFQGDEDKIVPPNQAEMMYNAVKAKGLPCLYMLFEGEQHGFRKAENIQKALDGEFSFFGQVFGFEPADQHFKVEIQNLHVQQQSA